MPRNANPQLSKKKPDLLNWLQSHNITGNLRVCLHLSSMQLWPLIRNTSVIWQQIYGFKKIVQLPFSSTKSLNQIQFLYFACHLPWHVAPENAEGQRQAKLPSSLKRHVPPLWHGFGMQGLSAKERAHVQAKRRNKVIESIFLVKWPKSFTWLLESEVTSCIHDLEVNSPSYCWLQFT